MTASAQEPSDTPPTSLARVRQGIDTPVVRTLAPATPVRLRTTFKSRVDQRIFVPTLEEDLHKTFDLTDLQRQSAAWSAQCCGINLSALFNRMEKAMEERRVSKIRGQIRRELADLKEANAAAAAR